MHNATLQFMRAFLRRPLATGSILPSSRFLAKRMVSAIEWDRAQVIVELGPGRGCITREILDRMRSNAVLIAIDTNPQFTAGLRESLADSRLRVVTGSALQIKHELSQAGFTHADCIISGLPFVNMVPDLRRGIVLECSQALGDRGKLVLFQYRTLLLPLLREVFSSVSGEFEWRNLPPAFVFCCSE